MEYNQYANLNSLSTPFDPSVKLSGFIEYSQFSTNKPYQSAQYGFGIKEPIFAGIPYRKPYVEQLCALPSKEPKIAETGNKTVFPEFDRGMLIYRK